MLIAKESKTEILNEQQVLDLCGEAFGSSEFDGQRILAVIPDHTRSAPMDLMFRIVYQLLADRVKQLDFMIALGTHPPMSDDMINTRVGIASKERSTKYTKARFFNHEWSNSAALTTIGTITAAEITDIANGLMSQEVPITINKKVLEYDLVLIIGPTFPHEVVGFSGGNKYLFPGIAGAEIIDLFHWLSALLTNPVIIGNKKTPVRQIIDEAASFVPVQRKCISMVVTKVGLQGVFIGSPEEAFSRAADLSAKVHIMYKEKPFQRILSVAPKMYDDMWVAGKCMYKLEPVLADGGELIIYAPHIDEVSYTHGRILDRIGYHVRDYYVKQMERFGDIPGGVMAHSTHVKGIGTFRDGVEKPRANVVLATRIPEERCQRLNLGYRDPNTIDENDWKDREDEGILYVPQAGEMLYRLKNDTFSK